jgi:hypothetical protein
MCTEHFFDCHEYFVDCCKNCCPDGCDKQNTLECLPNFESVNETPVGVTKDLGSGTTLFFRYTKLTRMFPKCSDYKQRVYMRGSLGKLTEDDIKFLGFNYDEFLIFFRRATDIPLDTPEESLEHSRLLDVFESNVVNGKMYPDANCMDIQINIAKRIFIIAEATRELRERMCYNLYKYKHVMGIPVEFPSPAIVALDNSPTPPTLVVEPQGEKKTANEKLQDFLLEHQECRAWTSKELAVQIGESAEAVRKTDTWKALSKNRKYLKEQNAIILKLKNERLSEADRRKLERKLDDREAEMKRECET